ncbi:hypothetical protein [Riemerella columbipharyngis]|uniref:Uncharacterized protein n=1 Tax=Riemerella columbipharyngis TaxID=1071918 RepID=A0A1G7BPX4_9FLAO|nr:hypothetical protein [Riemerella columbipharyngis]SDE28486.1 hypothetical protein SAMN05421544_10657 [Riemerella columbipharyngis]
MKKVNIQFFATLNENVEFLTDMYKAGFNILLRIDEPKANILIDDNNVGSIREILLKENVSYWDSAAYFSNKEYNTNCPFNEFSSYNPDIMFLRIGEEKPGHLKESWLATSLQFDDEELNLAFYRIGQRLKRNTKCGGILYSNDLNEGKFCKNVRYTGGALEFNQKGGKVYQFNPNVHFKLGV